MNGVARKTGFNFSSSDMNRNPIEPNGPYILTWVHFFGTWLLMRMEKVHGR